jgi:hypothetical protein
MGKQSWSKWVLTDSRKPTAAVSRHRFVDKNGDQMTVAGARARGIAADDFDADDLADGRKVNVVLIGVEQLEVGAATSVGPLTTDSVGRGVDAKRGDAVNAYGLEAGTAAGDRVPALVIQNDATAAPIVISIPIILASIAGAGDVVTGYTPGFAGTIVKAAFVPTKAVTTPGKAVTLNFEIGSTDLTGGVIALTSANCTPLGVVVAGTTITSANTFTATDTFSVESSSVTPFAEGEGVLLITVLASVP